MLIQCVSFLTHSNIPLQRLWTYAAFMCRAPHILSLIKAVSTTQ